MAATLTNGRVIEHQGTIPILDNVEVLVAGGGLGGYTGGTDIKRALLAVEGHTGGR